MIIDDFHYVFSISFVHNHLILLLIKHWLTNYRSCNNCESSNPICDSSNNDVCFFFMRTCIPIIPNMVNSIFSPCLQFSNGKDSFCNKKKKPYVDGFPFVCIVNVVGIGFNITTSCICKYNNPTTRLWNYLTMRLPTRSLKTREGRNNRLLNKYKIKLWKWQFKVSWQGEN